MKSLLIVLCLVVSLAFSMPTENKKKVGKIPLKKIESKMQRMIREGTWPEYLKQKKRF
jgi:hypothetical protein